MNVNDATRAATSDLAKDARISQPWARPKKQLRPRAELIGTPRERTRDLVGSLLLSPIVIGVLFLLYILDMQQRMSWGNWGSLSGPRR